MKAFIKKHKILCTVWLLTVVVFLGLASYYLVRANYYKTHFFPGTTLSSIDVSELTAEEATEKVSRYVADYLITIHEREDESERIIGPAIGYSYVPNGEIEKILDSQDEYAWMRQLKISDAKEIALATTFDEALLREEVRALDCMQPDQMVAPEDAHIQLGENGYELVPEVYGTTLSFDTVYQQIADAVMQGEREIDLEELYLNPKVFSDDRVLNECIDTIARYYGTSVTYEFGKEEPYELTGEMIQSWLTVDDAYQVHIDEEKVRNFVQYLASTYNTYADIRLFKTSLGDKLKIGGGDYGWVVDKEKEFTQLMEDLAKGENIVREPIYSQTAKKHGENDIGSTYVEIDYTNQHLWYYEKGELVTDTDIVSGNLGRNNGSPDGVFKIVYKQRNATLVGEGYSSPVDYFMPFAYNVGIHDASWRNKFGGEIYKTSGSHGCINVPPEIAEILYKKLEVGTPVIAYYREKVYLTAENARISNAHSYIDEEAYKKILKREQKKAQKKKEQEKKQEEQPSGQTEE
ncbi:MAG: L,D-transpeptidase family protein [bacterium]|nr:L,D-transpeptidase family protein [bacterium]